MKLRLERFKSDENATVGKLFIDDEFYCYTLEDEFREEKVRGETRIPAGIYRIEKRQVLSGLTKKYRARFPFFDYHFMLLNVPNFNYVYIHAGNFETQTDGCILVGKSWSAHKGTFAVWNSALTFEKVYNKLNSATDPILIEIINE